MKKTILALMLAVSLTLCSCGKTNVSYGETTQPATSAISADKQTTQTVQTAATTAQTTDTTQTTQTTQTPEPQISIDLADEQHDCEVCNAIKGMTKEEFEAFKEKYEVLERVKYSFWKDENGRHYVAEFSYDLGVVEKVMCFEDREVKYGNGVITDDIVRGMTVYDLVKNFGVPFKSPQKLSTVKLYFASDDGIEYCFTLMKPNGDYTVMWATEVDLSETNQTTATTYSN